MDNLSFEITIGFKDSCTVCGSNNFTMTNRIREKRAGLCTIIPDYENYPDGYPELPCCLRCLYKFEKEFIRAIEVDKLPLFINHRWVGRTSKEFFMSRLKGEF